MRQVETLENESGDHQRMIKDMQDQVDLILRQNDPVEKVTWLVNVLNGAQNVRAIIGEIIAQHIPVIGDARKPKLSQIAQEFVAQK